MTDIPRTATSGANFDTRIIHQDRDPATQGGMVNPPVYHGSTVIYPTLADLHQSRHDHKKKDAVVYGRYGNKSTFALENSIADLENGFGAIGVSSGLAAITTTILAYVSSGDHLLMVDTAYGPTRDFCANYLSRMGVAVTFYDPMTGADIESLIQENTRMIYMESPGSLTFEVQDVPAIVAVAKARGIATALDNSWASPLFYRPLDHGVNVSVIAATKYVVGHADAMMGLMVADSEETYYQLRQCRDLLGHGLAPDDIYLGARGLRTLPLRMRHHEQQALTLANWLNERDDVLEVLHPALPNCPGHDIWKRDFEGSSGLFSFIVKDRGKEALAAMVDHFDYFAMGFSWGGFESLIVPQDPSRVRSATGWEHPGLLLRIHAGLEHIDDLVDDMDRGLQRYQEAATAQPTPVVALQG